ncbi:hypothetical protein [Paenibacillus sp. LjRoot56]|uniref:hypothetical protein n=1 Tax=Paenibacillus sp. LjRoot56 TaxID=3342333 RepID=UPI003ED16760
MKAAQKKVDFIVTKRGSKQCQCQQDSGVTTKGDNSIEITPSTIQISEVLYGTEANGTITYLQHGYVYKLVL